MFQAPGGDLGFRGGRERCTLCLHGDTGIERLNGLGFSCGELNLLWPVMQKGTYSRVFNGLQNGWEDWRNEHWAELPGVTLENQATENVPFGPRGALPPQLQVLRTLTPVQQNGSFMIASLPSWLGSKFKCQMSHLIGRTQISVEP